MAAIVVIVGVLYDYNNAILINIKMLHATDVSNEESNKFCHQWTCTI